jgi:two-component system OmpR family response regulator
MASVIRRSLAKHGLAVDVAERARDTVWMAESVDYDAIVLDVMLPDGSGFAVCRSLRERGVWSPVLMLTARDAVADRVEGLDSGADDYLVKPFALAELHARLRSLARRGRRERPAVLEAAGLALDPARRAVTRDGEPVELSAKEFALLETLMGRPGEVLSRLDLIEHAWDSAYEARSNVVDVYVKRLRAKVDRPFGRDSIETIRGVGYRFRAER